MSNVKDTYKIFNNEYAACGLALLRKSSRQVKIHHPRQCRTRAVILSIADLPSNNVHGRMTRHTAETDIHNQYTAPAASSIASLVGCTLVHPAGYFVFSLVEYHP